MKKLVTCIAIALSTSAFASGTQASIDDIDTQIKQLQKQVATLQSQSSGTGGIQVGSPMVSGIGSTGQDFKVLGVKKDNDLPLLSIGGLIEGTVIYNKNSDTDMNYTDGDSSDASTQAADIRILANINDFTTGFMRYDLLGNNLRVAFITLGNLKQSPWYFTVGKQYTFGGLYGDYNTYSNSIVDQLFQTRTNGAHVGYSKGGLNIQAGAVSTDKSSLGFSGGIRYDVGNTFMGAGYLSDITGSEISAISTHYTQKVDDAAAAAEKVGKTSTYEEPKVSTYNIYIGHTFGPLTVSAEYASTRKGIDNQDKIKAWQIDAGYALNNGDIIGLDYSKAYGSAVLIDGVADNVASANYIREIFKNTTLAAEVSRTEQFNGDVSWGTALDLTVNF